MEYRADLFHPGNRLRVGSASSDESKAVEVLFELVLVDVDDLLDERAELGIQGVVDEAVQLWTHEVGQQVGFLVDLLHSLYPVFRQVLNLPLHTLDWTEVTIFDGLLLLQVLRVQSVNNGLVNGNLYLLEHLVKVQIYFEQVNGLLHCDLILGGSLKITYQQNGLIFQLGEFFERQYRPIIPTPVLPLTYQLFFLQLYLYVSNPILVPYPHD